jgi:uncharacterized membrane protein
MGGLHYRLKLKILLQPMNKKIDFFSANIFNIFIWFLVVINFLPIIAPILREIGLTLPADIIYTIYSFMCHQFHWRSIHIFDYQIAWCTRDTFIWLSFLTIALAYKFEFLKKQFNWYWMIPFTIPIALDGGIQTIATALGLADGEIIYLSTNLMRMITGSLFGIGLAIVIVPYMKSEQDNYINAQKTK